MSSYPADPNNLIFILFLYRDALRSGFIPCYPKLYAKVALHSLTALKMLSKCSFIPYKLRFFEPQFHDLWRLVTHDSLIS